MTRRQASKKPAWKQHGERSNHLMLSILVWAALNLGRTIVRLILYPTAFYFLLFAPKARTASRNYLTRILGRRPNWREIWRHFYTFAQVSVDRLYLLAGRTHLFDINIHGEDIINRYAHTTQGCLLLVAHLGSFDVMRVLGTRDKSLPIRILMDPGHNAMTMELINKLDPELAERILDTTQPATSLALTLNECLKASDMIGIMADRAGADDKLLHCDFLGDPAALPIGPWQLAATLRAPVLLCIGLYTGDNRYELHIESLTDQWPDGRQARREAIVDYMTHYTNRLEHHLKRAPYNWFNFYDFWADDTP